MFSKFLLGAGLGGLVGTGLLALASVSAPPPVVAPVAQPEVVVAPQPAPEPAPAPQVAPEAPVAPEAAPVAPEAVTEAPAAPEAPVAAGEAPAGPAPADAAVATAVPAAPAAPSSEGGPSAPEVPTPAPDLATPVPPAEPLAPTGEAAPGALATLDPQNPGAAPAAPAAPSVEAAPPAPDLPAPPPLTPEEEAMLAEVAPAPEPVPAPAPAPEVLPVADPAPEPAPAPDLPGSDDGKIVVGEGSTLPAEPGLTAEDGVKTDRLPRIGDAAAPEAVDTSPLVAHARPFDNAEGKPVFAVILIDGGDPATDRAALASLPFPVSFALDPMDPKAADYAAIYRAAGQEVIMLATGLPRGAQASDVEQAFQVMEAALPEAVAVMDLPEGLFQGDRPLATAVVPVIAAGGRGLVTWDQGLNAADQVARRGDVPATVAFRDLDAAGEDTPVIRRYLDRAAFKAAQEGRVTVIGRTRPETVAALLEWTIEGRAATVALAPVTAVLAVP